jgi:hypothetical protein
MRRLLRIPLYAAGLVVVGLVMGLGWLALKAGELEDQWRDRNR